MVSPEDLLTVGAAELAPVFTPKEGEWVRCGTEEE